MAHFVAGGCPEVLELALPNEAVEVKKASVQGQDQGQGELGGRHNGDVRGVDDMYVSSAGGAQVDVIQAGSGPTDDPQPGGRVDDSGGDVGSRSNQEGFGVGEGCDNRVRGGILEKRHVADFLETFNGFRGKLLGDYDPRLGVAGHFYVSWLSHDGL